MTTWLAAAFASLPDFTKKQLFFEREASGETQLSQIETEKFLAHLVSIELKKRKANQEYKGNFAPSFHFFGYQERCAFPIIIWEILLDIWLGFKKKMFKLCFICNFV